MIYYYYLLSTFEELEVDVQYYNNYIIDLFIIMNLTILSITNIH
jgi:hypothetical protein